MKLTAKQRLFADEYIKSGNATQSAIKAGYATKSAQRIGSENLSKPVIKSYIETKMAEIESHKIADAKEVLQYYTRVLRSEETEEVVDVVNGGLIESKPSIKERTAAAKELMKRYPLSDPLTQAHLEKLKADTRISKAKAKAMEDNGQDIATALDKIMDKLVDESDKEANND